jgi:hydrogenase/urease accessory protein HupE
MMHIEDQQFRAVHDFIIGAILLFALSISLLRRKIFLLSVPPIALWMYFAGGDYMQDIPSITTPLYFLLGALVSAALIISIGVSLGVTLTESIQDSMAKLKTMPAVSTFLSLF